MDNKHDPRIIITALEFDQSLSIMEWADMNIDLIVQEFPDCFENQEYFTILDALWDFNDLDIDRLLHLYYGGSSGR